MAQQQNNNRIERVEECMKRIEKEIYGNGGEGIKNKLNTVETQQKIMLKAGWLLIAVTVGQIGLYIAQALAK